MNATRPQTGDVIVRYKHHSAAFFILHIWGSSQETTCTTYNDALTLAKRTADPNRSDVWYTDDGLKFNLVLSNRES